MNRIDISAEEVPLPAWVHAARSFVLKTLRILRHNNWDVSILFCNDAFIRILNKKYRYKNTATDVLSFPIGDFIIENGKKRYISGDIIISLETLPVNAAYFGLSEDEELRRLLVHGLLHLAGFNHVKNDINTAILAVEPMLSIQESILIKLKEEKILC
ncbi:MAG: rRNA maturation RNase YbeY [Spirochaetaceae bacterium]|jgi:probable rRNA maturation factor|nr:rRNA maturation RNase YbeY [Spirochaetaceae bacterium]